MTRNTLEPDELASVTAPISYLVPMSGKPTTYVTSPPEGVPALNARYEWQPSTIRDARPLKDSLSLDREGFMLVDHVSALTNFWDDASLRATYYPEMEALVKELTGARVARVFDHTHRRRGGHRTPLSGNQWTFTDVREPVGKAHSDFTPLSARARLERELGDHAKPLAGRRFAILNVWRPLNTTPISDAPLAVLDAATVAPDDLVASDLVYADRVGETFNLTHSDAHRWYYFPQQTRGEVIVFKNFDSDGIAPFAPHSAFEDPTAPRDAPLRESLEVRLFAFF